MKSNTLNSNLLLSAIILLSFVFINSSCNDTSLVGTSLFNDDSLNINFTDTISIGTKSMKGDSSVYADYNIYLLGQDENDIFGSREATLYVDILRGSTPTGKYIDATIDSAVFFMTYDTTLIDINEYSEHNVNLYSLTEAFADTTLSVTNTSLNSSDLLNYSGGSTLITPSLSDTIIKDYINGGDPLLIDPQMRIRLNDQFVEMLTDSTYTENDSLFSGKFIGFKLESTSNQNTLMAFNFSASSYVQVYYNYGDTLFYVHNYPIGTSTSKRFNQFEHDYNGMASPNINTFFESSEVSDTILFLGGMAGSNIEVDLSALDTYQDRLLNYAEIIFYVNEEMDSELSLATNLICQVSNEEGERFTYSLDASLGVNYSQFSSYHDGYLNENEDLNEPKKYRIKLTSQLIEFLQNNTTNKKVIISVLNKTSRPNRSILYGANHSEYPAHLRAVFTD